MIQYHPTQKQSIPRSAANRTKGGCLPAHQGLSLSEAGGRWLICKLHSNVCPELLYAVPAVIVKL